MGKTSGQKKWVRDKFLKTPEREAGGDSRGGAENDRTAAGGTVTREFPLDQFPTPEELWTRYCASKGLTPEQIAIATQDYYNDGSGKIPHSFQSTAINRSVEAIARGQICILLVMATGTGKTYTAFQIIWRGWKAKKKKRILFLVDRNILADQTKSTTSSRSARR